MPKFRVVTAHYMDCIVEAEDFTQAKEIAIHEAASHNWREVWDEGDFWSEPYEGNREAFNAGKAEQ